MIERVRAVLVTADYTMLVIRRTKPEIPEYWVLPGGGVEPSDESREAALHREIHEEIGGGRPTSSASSTHWSPTTSASSSTSPASRPGPSRTAPVPSSAPRAAANTRWSRSL
ncbi:NUDIX domain-containing protein [Streptomyces erythrochromogenes]|uniref:NUDIX domain-containing protein n=1 Tax=Streptomyces erythrochromogenes TaxID=285574 RepID=UPI0036FFE756